MKIESIEHLVDKMTISNTNIIPKPKKHLGKRSKYLAVLSVLLLVSGIGAYAGIFTFFVQQETNVTLEDTSLLEWDDTPAEDLSVNEDISGMGGESFEYIHWLNLSDDSPNDLEIEFSWSGNVTSEGIYCNISFWNGANWVEIVDNSASPNADVYTLTIGELLKVKTYYELDEKIEYRTDYQVILTIV